ncbi:FAD-NAD(P)-binding-domain-containing protein [Hypoxylon sp. FL0543]|nr:FAD-NAD(P)-binding-domain-containing protein [Hypoxylon sp. FL0543]
MTYSLTSTLSRRTQAEVAIVGMGPRGTSVLERICASASDILVLVSSQVTLFTDDSVVCSGPIRPGPSLYEWVAQNHPDVKLGPDDYPTRALYGRYLEWVFSEVLRRAPSDVKVEVHAARAVRLDNELYGRQALTLSNGRTIFGLAAVVLAQGHLPLVQDAQQQQLARYAKQHGLRHFSPSNPADLDLSSIAPGEPILLRGLGLNFFDHMTLLTIGRGGRFESTSEGLRYHASGKEPRLYAGSRRGIPYQARGDNQKGAYGRRFPILLTDKVIAGFRERADSGDAPNFMSEIWPIVAKEVELVYYEGVLGQIEFERLNFQQRFFATPHGSPEEAQLLTEVGITEAKRWSWARISRPQGERTFATVGDWQNWLLAYLRTDAEEAALGNVEGPTKAALDMMRDLRNELRQIVDHDGLAGASRRDHLDRWYTPLNAFVSIGPPRQRIEQMIALMEAGVLEVLGPRFGVREEDGAWVAESPEIPDSAVRVTTLIEARLPEPSLRHTADELLSHLMKTGQCRPHIVNGYETGGLDVTHSPYALIDRQGRAHERRFAVGVPTEGVHWVTAAGARPGVNSVTLCDTDAVARAALHVVTTETEVVEMVATETKEPLMDANKVWPIIEAVVEVK